MDWNGCVVVAVGADGTITAAVFLFVCGGGHPWEYSGVVVAVGADGTIGTIAAVPFVLLETLPDPTLLRFAALIILSDTRGYSQRAARE